MSQSFVIYVSILKETPRLSLYLRILFTGEGYIVSNAPQVTIGSESSNNQLSSQLGLVSEDVDALSGEVTSLSGAVTTLDASVSGLSDEVADLTTEVSSFTSQLESLDTTLNESITLETNARVGADNTLSGLISSLTTSTSAADTALDARLDTTELVGGYGLTTNTLIQSALSAYSLVTPSRIAYQAGDVDDLIAISGPKILKFIDCSNVAFSFRWTDNSAVPPKLIFQNCILNSSKSDFLSLLDMENATEEIRIETIDCFDSTGVPLPNFSYLVVGGLS